MVLLSSPKYKGR